MKKRKQSKPNWHAPYRFWGIEEIPEMTATIGIFYKNQKTAIKKAAEFQRRIGKPYCILTARRLKGYLVVSQRQLEKIDNQTRYANYFQK